MKKNEKVTVIGGSGFLGSHLADTLSDLGYEVVIFDQKPSGWIRPDQQMALGNILEYDQVEAAVKGAQYVYQLAGISDISQAANNPRAAIETNIIGSTNVIEACVKEKVSRLLLASTIYAYSDKGSFYRVSKAAVESILEAYHDRFALEYTILRYGSLYGPRAQDWNGLKKWVVQGLRDGKIQYPGKGDERREYIHVKDAAELSVKALAPEFANQCLTLTGTQVMPIKEVLGMIKEISGRPIEIEFTTADPLFSVFHYSLTPYRYSPRPGKKIIPTVFIDLGQGILELIEETAYEYQR